MSNVKLGELRINNWYESTKFKVPVKCDASDISQIYYNADGAAVDEDHIAMVFKPIPITVEWLEKMYQHGNGIVLVPDRSSTDWWQDAAKKSDAMLMVKGKIKFIKPDGTTGDSPSTGTTLFAYGEKAVNALKQAEKNRLGIVLSRVGVTPKEQEVEKEPGNSPI